MRWPKPEQSNALLSEQRSLRRRIYAALHMKRENRWRKKRIYAQKKKINNEEKTTHSDIIPILIHHHHAQQHTQRKKEQPINIMLDRITDRHAEREQQHLPPRIKDTAKDDIANGPPVLERAEDEDELRDDVDDGAHERPQNVDDPEANWLGKAEASEALEGGDRNEEADTEDNEAGYPKEL